MMTVKELSNRTGISARTLHYYDEIGLLAPTDRSESGYRLYDDEALETLQQILFFREFDVPLKEIKAILDHPTLNRNQILQIQRTMLVMKQERIERLIERIDEILAGNDNTGFEIFSRSELEEISKSTYEHMPDSIRQAAIAEFGSFERWQAHYVERALKEDMQQGYRQMLSWYGSKETAFHALKKPPGMDAVRAAEKQSEAILKKLSGIRDIPPDSLEVKEIVWEYRRVVKDLYQLEHESDFMLAVAKTFLEERIATAFDEKYGRGTAKFFSNAIVSFYGKQAFSNS